MLTTTAATPGQRERLRAATIVPPCRQIHRNPVLRVSPWAMVLVAYNLHCAPSGRRRSKAAAKEVGHQMASP